MLHRRNRRRRGYATPLLLVIVLLATAGRAAAAGTDEQLQPDPHDAVRAYTTVRGWLDDFRLPPASANDSRVSLKSVRGVCIILRQSGRVVASGTDVSNDAMMLRRAAGRAFGELLGDPLMAAMPEGQQVEIASRLTLELDLAGPMRPLLGRTYEQLADNIVPGLDGLAVRRGNKLVARFPALSLATRVGDAAQVAPGLVIDLGLPAMDLAQLIARHGVTFYRFRTIHLAQPEAASLPVELFRGQAIVPERDVSAESLAASADAMARHIIRCRYSSPSDQPQARLGMMGEYHENLDAFDPLIASPLDQALLSLALQRYATAPGINPSLAAEALSLSVAILEDLAVVEPAEVDPRQDLLACGALLYAAAGIADQLEVRPDIDALVSDAVDRVLSAYSREQGGFVREGANGEPDRPLEAHGQALVAGGLARLLRSGAREVDASIIRTALDRAWTADPTTLVALLPWCAWAEIDLVQATGDPLANRERLLALRTILNGLRVGSGGLEGPADERGGFALTGESGRPFATAQSLRPAAFLATILGEPALTSPGEAMLELGRHLRTIRFLMQLTVREEDAWRFRNPDRTIGGVRVATWEYRQPAAAQALGLLTAAETLISLNRLAAPDAGDSSANTPASERFLNRDVEPRER